MLDNICWLLTEDANADEADKANDEENAANDVSA